MSSQKNSQVQFHKEENFNGIRVSPIVSSTRMSDVKEYFDNNTILGKELPIISNSENSKKNNCGPREFYIFQTNEGHSMWQGHHMDECYMNELAKGKDDVLLVLDFDIKETDEVLFERSEENDEDVYNILYDSMCKLSEKIDPECGIRFGLFTSSRKEKISYHVIFENVSIKFKEIPIVIKEMIEKLDYSDEDRKYIFKPNNVETWFDMSIYPTSDESIRSLRLVGHAKRCNDIKLFYKGGTLINKNLYIRHRSSVEFNIERKDDMFMCGYKYLFSFDKKEDIRRDIKVKFNDKIDKTDLTEILSRLNEERRSYYYRIRIMFGIYNTYGEEGREIFDEFIKQGKKDRYAKANSNWNEIKSSSDNEKKIGLGTIFRYLEEDDYDYYIEYHKNKRKNPIDLFHDIGFKDITFDTLYNETGTRTYKIDKDNGINELKDLYYMVKASIAMFKTPDIYYRLKRVETFKTGEEVVYQNTKKIQCYVKTITHYTDANGQKRTKNDNKPLEFYIGSGVKLGIMYNFLTFYPSILNNNDLNTFTGFLGAMKEEENDSNVNISYVIDHIKRVLCYNNDEIAEYLLNIYANKIQRPWEKTNVIPVLVGTQGCGKSILFENLIIPYLIGSRYCKTIDTVEQMMEKHFSFAETILLRFEEALFEGNKQAISRLKQLSTGKDHLLNEKFMPIRTIESFMDIVIISNHENCVSVEFDDRRFLMLRCDAIRKGDEEYFKQLSTCFNAGGGRQFYKYLMGRELKPITEPPGTELKLRVMEMSKDKLNVFHDRVTNGEFNNFRTVKHNKEYYLAFSGEEIVKSIGDHFLTISKAFVRLEKLGWIVRTVRLSELGNKQVSRYLIKMPILGDDWNDEE